MVNEASETRESTNQPTISPEGSKVTKIPGVKLEVSLGKEVVVRIPGLEHNYRGKIVGLDPYDYIIANVRLPRATRKELSFGGKIILKYIHKGTVYGFRSHVHNAISSPAPLLFFEYPKVIERINLRRASRHKCSIYGGVHTTDGDFDCLITNVSESGCKISARASSRDPLSRTRVDDAMLVSMNLGNDGMVKLPIAVRNVSLKKGVLNLGTMFLDIQKEETQLIQNYLDKIERLTR